MCKAVRFVLEVLVVLQHHNLKQAVSTPQTAESNKGTSIIQDNSTSPPYFLIKKPLPLPLIHTFDQEFQDSNQECFETANDDNLSLDVFSNENDSFTMFDDRYYKL